MKRSKILLEKAEEAKDFVEYLELLYFEDIDEYLDEYLDEEEKKICWNTLSL